MDGLVREAVFGDAETTPASRWIIGEAAQALGIRPASIHDLYRAEGQAGAPPRFTVPAINLRLLAYDAARAVFRAARKIDAGAFIFENRQKRDRLYRAAPGRVRRGRPGRGHPRRIPRPLFLQCDHFQISAKKYAAAPDSELQAIHDLIVESFGRRLL